MAPAEATCPQADTSTIPTTAVSTVRLTFAPRLTRTTSDSLTGLSNANSSPDTCQRSDAYLYGAIGEGGGGRALPPPAYRVLDLEVDDRDDQDGDDVGHLDHRVDRRAGRVLVGVADGVAGDRGGMGLGALAAEGAVLGQLLRVVPGTAAGGHRDRGEEADDDDADQQAAERVDAEQADDDRDHDRDQRRQDHLFLRRQGDDADRLPIVGLFGPLHDSRALADILEHLFDDLTAGTADRLDREGREQVDHHAADDQPDQDVGAGQVEEAVEVEAGRRLVGELALEGGEQHQS